jgi:hypothetical protein
MDLGFGPGAHFFSIILKRIAVRRLLGRCEQGSSKYQRLICQTVKSSANTAVQRLHLDIWQKMICRFCSPDIAKPSFIALKYRVRTSVRLAYSGSHLIPRILRNQHKSTSQTKECVQIPGSDEMLILQKLCIDLQYNLFIR